MGWPFSRLREVSNDLQFARGEHVFVEEFVETPEAEEQSAWDSAIYCVVLLHQGVVGSDMVCGALSVSNSQLSKQKA